MMKKKLMRAAVLAVIGAMVLSLGGCGSRQKEKLAHSSVMAETQNSDGTMTATIEGYSFSVPDSWTRADNSKDTQRYYSMDGGNFFVAVYQDDTDFSDPDNQDNYIASQTRDFTDFEMDTQEVYQQGVLSGVHFTGTFDDDGSPARADYLIVNAEDDYAFVIGMIDHPDSGKDYSEDLANILASFTKD